MMPPTPPRKNGDVSCACGDIIVMCTISAATAGTVIRSLARRYATASSSRSMIMRGCSPGGTAVCFVCSSAFFQSSPKPSAREAFFISSSHHANSLFASAMSCSGVYGIMLSSRS